MNNSFYNQISKIHYNKLKKAEKIKRKTHKKNIRDRLNEVKEMIKMQAMYESKIEVKLEGYLTNWWFILIGRYLRLRGFNFTVPDEKTVIITLNENNMDMKLKRLKEILK